MSYSSEVLADSPVVYFRMNDASGTTMTDSSGSSRNGTYFNSPTFGTTGATDVSDGDDAVTFNGTSQYANVASASSGDTALKAMTGAFTVECWVNLSTTAGTRGFMDRYNNGVAGESVWLLYMVSAKPRFLVRNTTGNVDVFVQTTTTLTTSTWYHIVGVFDDAADLIRIYVNGVEDATAVSMTGAVGHSRTPVLTLGRLFFTSGYFPGVMDEVAVYPSALSSTRIAAHYAAATAAPPSGTFAAVTPVPSASFTGSYTPPAQTGTFDVDLPVPVPAFTGSYQAPPTGSFAATLTVPVADFTGSYSSPPTPTGSLDAVLPVPTVAFTGSYIAPESGTFAVDLPVPVASFAGTYTPAPISGSFAVDLLLPVADFAGVVAGLSGTFAVSLPVPTVEFTGSYGGPYPTDTSNDLGGIRLEGSGTATVTRPVAAPPATLVLAHRVDKAAAYPTPTMVNGRPT